MTPTDIDDIAAKIKSDSGAAHVEIRITSETGMTVIHEAGRHPDYNEDWHGIVERIEGDRAKLVGEASDG